VLLLNAGFVLWLLLTSSLHARGRHHRAVGRKCRRRSPAHHLVRVCSGAQPVHEDCRSVPVSKKLSR
jgi:hypothetical protein